MSETSQIGKREALDILRTTLLTTTEAWLIRELIERLDRALCEDLEVFQEIHLLGCGYAEDHGGRSLTCYHLRPPHSWCGPCIAGARINGLIRDKEWG